MSGRRPVNVKRKSKNANNNQNKPKSKPKTRKNNNNQQPQKTRKSRRNKRTRNQNMYGGPFSMKKNTSRDYRCVVAEETIGTIASNNSTAFGVLNTFNINPGNATSFPLLSQEAAVFETYKFDYLEFYTVPSVSGFAAGGQTGSVSISVDFNASHAQPISYTAAVDLDPNDEDLPCNDLRIVLPPEKMHQQNLAKFIRTGGLPGSSDIKTYDVGNLFVCCEGLNASQFNVNRLYVKYKCHLYTRVDVAGAGAPQNNSVTSFQDTNAALTTATPYQPLLAAAASATVVNVNGINVVNTAGSIVPPAGNYLWNFNCYYHCTGSSLTLVQASVNKNVSQQGPTAEIQSSAMLANYLSLHLDGYISCNGTDAITTSILADFSAGTTTATSVFTLVAI